MLTQHIIRTAVEAALAEDAPYGDITCETTIPADETGSAHLTACLLYTSPSPRDS